MKLILNSISEDPKSWSFSENDPWVYAVYRELSEEDALGQPSSALVDHQCGQQMTSSENVPSRPGVSFLVEAYRNQDFFHIKGRIRCQVNLLCSRCAQDTTFQVDSRFHSIFTTDAQFNVSGARTGHSSQEEAQNEEEDAQNYDIDMEFLDKDFIELSDVLREQLYLQLPINPLCQEECKGLCPTCGQNQNTSPCQCHRFKMGPLAKGLQHLRF